MPGTWVCPGSESLGPAPQVFAVCSHSGLWFPAQHSPLHPQTCVRLLSSGRPMLYSFQTSLPKLPVPSVPATIQRVRAWDRVSLWAG